MLAAGGATRYGATKQLVDVDGRPLVAHAVEAGRDGGADRVVVVVGHDAAAVAQAAEGAGTVEVVHNPSWAQGQAGSLVAGLDAAERAGADVAVVLLADQPGIAPAAVRAVGAAVAAGAPAARARYDDAPGHPVAFARRVWPRVRAEVAGDVGARDLLEAIDVVEVPVAGPAPQDVDTPDDLPGASGR